MVTTEDSTGFNPGGAASYRAAIVGCGGRSAAHAVAYRRSRQSVFCGFAERSYRSRPRLDTAADSGELRFRFLLTGDTALLPYLSMMLEQPPPVLPVPPSRGNLPRVGTIL